MQTVSMQHLLVHQHVLLLQGKMGSFFHRFSSFLQQHDITVSKINFNAGDKFFYTHHNAYDYQGTEADFSDWLAHFIDKQGVDAVVCFGDCRPHHLLAAELCDKKNVSFFVFEEGYLRPDYITFEEHGINGFSRLDIEKISTLPKAHDHPLYTNNRFYRLTLSTILYYIIAHLGQDKFPHYAHYRGMSAWQEAGAWLKAPVRKAINYIPDKLLLSQYLTKIAKKPYFLVPLQVHNDTQITHHSDYHDVTDFIEEIIASFSKHAKPTHSLLFKQHPLDRGHRNYRPLINTLAKQYGIDGRVYYGCDMHLPTMIKHSLGMVTINSTTGLQSIYHQRPTKVMGRAIYNVDKLTDQQPLDSFWQNPQQPDNEFYLRFREYLIEQNQMNGSFFGDSPWMNEYPTQSKLEQPMHHQKHLSSQLTNNNALNVTNPAIQNAENCHMQQVKI